MLVSCCKNTLRQINPEMTGLLETKDPNPVGEFAFSDPVSWQFLPTDHPAPLVVFFLSADLFFPISNAHNTSVPALFSTFHNGLIQMNIRPAEDWIRFSTDPSSILYKKTTCLSLFIHRFMWHVPIPQLAMSLMQKSQQPLAGRNTGFTKEDNTCVQLHLG